MDIDEIEKRVKEIEDNASDDEGAHSAEDALRADFISYIADNYNGDLAIMARAILKTEDIEFARWCA